MRHFVQLPLKFLLQKVVKIFIKQNIEMINIVQVACDAGSCPESVQCPTHLIKTMNLSTSADCCPSYYCGTFLQS